MKRSGTLLVLLALCGAGLVLWRRAPGRGRRPAPLGWAARVRAVAGAEAGRTLLEDPFGLAADGAGNLYVADGGEGNRILKLAPDGTATVLAGGREGFADGVGAEAAFHTPSGLALDAVGNLYVADTGNHAIRRVAPDGRVTTLAGGGEAGWRDGRGREARFDGPVGVAVDGQGTVYVADAYNDRIRAVAPDGQVRTLAGGEGPGFQDGPGAEARFDTPCAVLPDGRGGLLVADTRNDALRRIGPDGRVETLLRDLPGEAAPSLRRPTALAFGNDGSLYVSEGGRGRILQRSPDGRVAALKEGAAALRLRRTAGLAPAPDGGLFAADAADRTVRRLLPPGPDPGPSAPGALQAAEAPVRLPERAWRGPFPWPLAPQDRRHEVVATLGEVRGTFGGDSRDHLHAGIDIHGEVGERVLAVAEEKVADPLSTWGWNGPDEGLSVGEMSYIHMRVGRTAAGACLDPRRFLVLRDARGRPQRVRVRRGTRFHVGDALGTVNAQAHVHLGYGPPGGARNPLVLPLAGFEDHVPPRIEGIRLLDGAGRRLEARVRGRLRAPRSLGDLAIVVDAYDQVDGNRPDRRLGLYTLGYEILRADGTAVPGAGGPGPTLRFDRLPPGRDAVRTAYADASGITVYGSAATRFLYQVTNRVGDGRAEAGRWRVADLPPGDYVVRIHAADFAGNEALAGRDLPVAVE